MKLAAKIVTVTLITFSICSCKKEEIRPLNAPDPIECVTQRVSQKMLVTEDNTTNGIIKSSDNNVDANIVGGGDDDNDGGRKKKGRK